MRIIAAVAFLAICQGAYGQPTTANAKGAAATIDNLLGTSLTIINNDLAWLAPYGRKLQQKGELSIEAPIGQRHLLEDHEHDHVEDPIQQWSIVKGNAESSIFYGTGFSNPEIVQAAITGKNPSEHRNRKLAQAIPDPYNLIPKANLVASILTGNVDKHDDEHHDDHHDRKLSEVAEPELVWDTASVNEALGFGRKLTQDQLAANYLGSAIYGATETANEALHKDHGRNLLEEDDKSHDKSIPSAIDPTRTGFLGTGSKKTQDEAIAKIAKDPQELNDPKTVRKATLGFQQDANEQGR